MFSLYLQCGVLVGISQCDLCYLLINLYLCGKNLYIDDCMYYIVVEGFTCILLKEMAK